MGDDAGLVSSYRDRLALGYFSWPSCGGVHLMLTEPEDDVGQLIRAARLDEPGAVDRLLSAYRNYLGLFAQLWLNRSVQAKADPSDLVQEALLRAGQRFEQFHGASEAELAAWLRRILARICANLGRFYRTGARDVARERSLDEMLNDSSHRAMGLIAGTLSTPSQAAQRRELGVVLADALAALREEHREVIMLRNLQELEWPEVAARMQRSVGAAQMLWGSRASRVTTFDRGQAMNPSTGANLPADGDENGAPLVQVLEQYLASLETGNPISRTELLAKHPELAEDLEKLLGEPGVRPPRHHFLSRRGDFRQAAGRFSALARDWPRGDGASSTKRSKISLRRRVALKVLPLAAMLDPRRLQRFRNEAAAAATLEHPNVMSIYSVGCERGVHYYAMQFIEGRTLAEVIQQLRRAETAGDVSIGSAETDPLAADRESLTPPVSQPRGLARELAMGPTASTGEDSPRRGGEANGKAFGSREFFRDAAKLGIQAAEALEHAHPVGRRSPRHQTLEPDG